MLEQNQTARRNSLLAVEDQIAVRVVRVGRHGAESLAT